MLEATPGAAALGELARAPGSLAIPLAVPGANGRLACLGFRAAAARDWLLWMIDHPEQLTWPEGVVMKRETERLRRCLFHDEPPGSRAGAQERAREVALASSPNVPAWWRLEEVADLDCVLTSDRFVLVVEGRPFEEVHPVTPWYPARTPVVRALEAARRLAGDGQRFAALVLSDEPVASATPQAVAASLAAAAPHLDDQERAALLEGYLGNLTWSQAREAVAVA